MLVEPGSRHALTGAGDRPPNQVDGLLRAAARGELPAFGQLYDQTATRVFGLARGILRNAGLAEDVTQEVFFEIWRRAQSFDHTKGSALSWMLALTRSRAIDRVRRTETSRSHDRAFLRASYYPVVETVSDRMERTENDRWVHVALAKLTALQRQAVHLTYFLGHTNSEASALLGIPLPTFKDRLRAAIIALRRQSSAEQFDT